MRFVNAIVVVSTVAAGLFVVHQGLHIRIYSAEEYFQTVFRGQVITRTFVFMSPLLHLRPRVRVREVAAGRCGPT